MENELWNVWSSCHEEPDQKKRIASAKKTACTPVFLDQTIGTGQFRGSSGNHTTSLEKCSCIDFNRRRKPCKHMYRLAMELNLFQESFESNTADILEVGESREAVKTTISKVESLSEDQQKLLLKLLRKYSSKNPVICAPKSDNLNALIDSGILCRTHHPEVLLEMCKKNELLNVARSINLSPDRKMLKDDLLKLILDNAKDKLDSINFPYESLDVNDKIRYGKLHSYLHRKFDKEHNFMGLLDDPLPLLETKLPEDDVTDLLREYGYYKL